TSVEPSDDPVAQFCGDTNVACVRGDLHDVAGRFLTALEATTGDGFVRISGDSPLLDPALIRQALDLFTETGADLVTNVLERTYPKGMSVEAVRADAFRRAYAEMNTPDEFEHVTAHFYKAPARWNIADFTSGRDLGAVSLSVDTGEDFARFEGILARMEGPHWTYGMDAVLALANADRAVPA
ncbi:MAG: hypothetical protein VW618_07805, partial [Alphaproteobacteria bacterium]